MKQRSRSSEYRTYTSTSVLALNGLRFLRSHPILPPVRILSRVPYCQGLLRVPSGLLTPGLGVQSYGTRTVQYPLPPVLVLEKGLRFLRSHPILPPVRILSRVPYCQGLLRVPSGLLTPGLGVQSYGTRTVQYPLPPVLVIEKGLRFLRSHPILPPVRPNSL